MTEALRVIEGGLSHASPEHESAIRAVLTDLANGFAKDFSTADTFAALTYYAGLVDIVPGLTVEERMRRREARVFVLKINDAGKAWMKRGRDAR